MSRYVCCIHSQSPIVSHGESILIELSIVNILI